MIIRLATQEDITSVLSVYDSARAYMRSNGNPYQWGYTYPSYECVSQDIMLRRCYVVIEDDVIVGAFVFFIGDDPTYKEIYDGRWINSDSYGVVHRIASNGKARGVLKSILDYCFSRCDNIRVDTHNDNKIMQWHLENYGFTRCGTIYIEDGSERIAYQMSR